MERARAKSPLPLPARGIIRKSSSSSSVLEEILGRKGRSSTPSVGYGLADAYRKIPTLPNNYLLAPIHHHPPTLDQGSARARSPLVPVPLTKSASEPPTGWFLDEAAAAAAANDPAAWERAVDDANESGWKCRGCSSTDAACLVDGPSADTVCGKCGTVASLKMVAGNRQKNCPVEEDRTIVADLPSRDVHQTHMEALSKGSESAYERRRRHLGATGGTRVAQNVMKRHGFGKAYGQMETQAVRDTRETIEGDSRDARKRRAILTVIEFTFLQDGVDKLDERIKANIRQEANRIYSASLEHEACCDPSKCQLALTNRSNALVAGCIIQNALEHLCRTSTPDATTGGCSHPRASPVSAMAHLHEVASDVSPITLATTLAAVKKLNVGNAGSVQRLSTLAAIRIVSRWTKYNMCQPCAPPEPAPPTVLCRPVSMAATIEQRGGAAAADPGDPAFKLRDRLIGMGRITNARVSIQSAALTAISSERVTAFLVKSTMPVNVIAVAMLRASASTLARDDNAVFDPTAADAPGICEEHGVSPEAFDTFCAELVPILADAKPSAALDAAFF